MPAASQPEHVVLINDFVNVRGGTTSQVRKLAGLLCEAGKPFTYFSGEMPEAEIDGARHIAVGGQRLVETSALRAATKGLRNSEAEAGLVRLIEEIDTPATVYHVHGWTQILSPSIFRALEAVADRVIFHAHDFSIICPNVVYFDFLQSRTCERRPLSSACLLAHCDKRSYPQKLWRFERHRRFYRNAERLRKQAHVISVHEDMKPTLRRGGVSGPIHPIRNATRSFLDQPISAEKNGDIVYVGQLREFKGALDFAEAARGIGARAVVIGEGPALDEMKVICPDATFAGWNSGEALQARMRAARVVVCPTRGIEPFGLVVAEALKSGIPVIASDGVLLGREVEKLGMGLRYPVGDVGALGTAIERVVADDELVADMSRNAARHGASLCPDDDTWFGSILEVYSSVLGSAGAERQV